MVRVVQQGHRRLGGLFRRRLTAVLTAFLIVSGGALLAVDALFSQSPPQPSMTVSAPPEPPEEPPVEEVFSLPYSEPTRVAIPEIGVDSEIISLGLQEDGTVEVPEVSEAHLTGWYRYGAAPGESGASVILGHVDSTTGPAVFYELGALEEGDEVEVDREDGRTAVFEVSHSERVPKDDFPTERVYADPGHPVLRLVTCGGDFDQQERSYTDNVIVYAGLVEER